MSPPGAQGAGGDLVAPGRVARPQTLRRVRADANEVQGAPLSEEALATVLEALPRQPLLIGEAGLRPSLAGAQAKVPVVRRGEGIALPQPGEPSTHILKPAIPDFPDSVANEAFVMRLAARVGLDVAPVETGEAGGRPYLLVTRYDRAWGEGGRVRRLHQEDFCQALGIPPERKYAAEKGLAFPDCFALVRRASERASERARGRRLMC